VPEDVAPSIGAAGSCVKTAYYVKNLVERDRSVVLTNTQGHNA
jgi:hypothetical protein